MYELTQAFYFGYNSMTSQFFYWGGYIFRAIQQLAALTSRDLCAGLYGWQAVEIFLKNVSEITT
jgi:hypothetical protein